MFEKFDVLKNEEMKKHTSFKIGGPAKYFLVPKNISELKKILSVCQNNNLRYFILGNGTNILVADKGFNGVVISLTNFNKIKKRTYLGFEYITVDAGVSLFSLNNFLLKNSIGGLEWSYGIPGTIGGAVKMNAGAYENSIGNFVKEIKYLKDEKISICKDFNFSYRQGFEKGIILSVKLKLKKTDPLEIKEKMSNYLSLRKLQQPYEYASAGSVFKRNGDLIPAKIIDELGLKGMRIGDAMVSTKHAGFIINLKNATSKDVTSLINLIESIFNSNSYHFDKEIVFLE